MIDNEEYLDQHNINAFWLGVTVGIVLTIVCMAVGTFITYLITN